MKVCVTGAAGMTGRVTVNHLLDQGYDVVATDTVPHPGAGIPPLWSPRFTYTRADLTDYGDTIDVLTGCDAVVHLAFWDDPATRRFNLWSYVDVRDCAQSCAVSLRADVAGASSYVIAAADTVMTTPSAQLLAAVFPNVPIRATLGEFETLQSIAKARSTIGYEPRHSWRDHIEAR